MWTSKASCLTRTSSANRETETFTDLLEERQDREEWSTFEGIKGGVESLLVLPEAPQKPTGALGLARQQMERWQWRRRREKHTNTSKTHTSTHTERTHVE